MRYSRSTTPSVQTVEAPTAKERRGPFAGVFYGLLIEAAFGVLLGLLWLVLWLVTRR